MTDGLTDLVLDRDAEVPIGVQLAWALRTRIRDGRFAPGQRLPALRDLAVALGINANTVRAVYQRLEHEGIIDSQQGSGTFVADLPPTPSAVGSIAALAAQEAHDTGVDPRDVAAALYVEPKSSPGRPTEEASRRRRLHTQIAALELTLGELASRHPALARKPARPASKAGPRLLDVAELEQIKAQLVAQIAALHAAIEELGIQSTAESGPPKAAAPAGASKRAPRARAKTRPAPAGA
ncbi:MAG: GntR family transcriptional regulator [Solirubrobacterales bacterium]